MHCEKLVLHQMSNGVLNILCTDIFSRSVISLSVVENNLIFFPVFSLVMFTFHLLTLSGHNKFMVHVNVHYKYEYETAQNMSSQKIE